MSALIIIMLWIALNLTIENVQKRKKDLKNKRVKHIQKKIYDFDILSYEDDFTELKKSA